MYKLQCIYTLSKQSINSMSVRKKIELEGYEVIERVTKPIGNSAYAPVPKNWLNKRVALVLLEPNADEE
jgi:putative transposon-encoded protein